MRLALIISRAGIASRRKAEDHIRAGRVTVNGVVLKDCAVPVDPLHDVVLFDGKPLQDETLVYYKVHKPVGYVSTVADAHAEKRVVDLVPKTPHVFPVGRLDKDSSGLLLLTNDGELAYTLTHPKFEHQKEYLVRVREFIPHDVPERLQRGIRTHLGIVKADAVVRETAHQLRITLHEGKNRQIRRMLGVVKLTVVTLVRVREGNVRLGDLKPGAHERLTRKDIL